MYKAVTGQFRGYSGREHQPCQEQEPEHCSAVCQETTRTAALKLNVARQTYKNYIYKNSGFPQDCETEIHAPQIHILKISATRLIRTKERLRLFLAIFYYLVFLA